MDLILDGFRFLIDGIGLFVNGLTSHGFIGYLTLVGLIHGLTSHGFIGYLTLVGLILGIFTVTWQLAAKGDK